MPKTARLLLHASFYLGLFAFPILPGTDVAPERGSGGGDCSLVSEARANMPPPVENCLYSKLGDKCVTLDGRAGKCEDACKQSDAPEWCQDPDATRPVLKCVSSEKPCDPADAECKRKMEIRKYGYPLLEPSSDKEKQGGPEKTPNKP